MPASYLPHRVQFPELPAEAVEIAEERQNDGSLATGSTIATGEDLPDGWVGVAIQKRHTDAMRITIIDMNGNTRDLEFGNDNGYEDYQIVHVMFSQVVSARTSGTTTDRPCTVFMKRLQQGDK